MKNHLLDFVVGGVQKAGTTSLFSYLQEHPALAVPVRKELHYFDDETRNWSSGTFDDLSLLIPNKARGQLGFDVTPIYLFWEPSVARMARYNADLKIILLFRDPVERAFSHWCMEYARGHETLNFSDAVTIGRERLRTASPLSFEWRTFSYVERGLYSEQLQRLLRFFPKDQLLFLTSEDLARDPKSCLDQISRFLLISDFKHVSARHVHTRADISYPSALGDKDVVRLSRIFQQDLARFSSQTGIDVANWLTMRSVAG